MNINAPNEDNLCFIKNVLEQGATLIDSLWLFFSFSQVEKLAHTPMYQNKNKFKKKLKLRFIHLNHIVAFLHLFLYAVITSFQLGGIILGTLFRKDCIIKFIDG